MKIKVRVQKKKHPVKLEYGYLATWSINGITYGDWFPTLKEVKEYVTNWECEIEEV